MKVLYISGGNFGYECFETLIETGVDVVGLISYDEQKRQQYSDVIDFSDLCNLFGVKHFPVTNINSESTKLFIKEAQPELLLVMGWSQIIDEEILQIPLLGVVGVHFAFLPKYRGRAPIPWTILKRLKETGITLMFLDKGIDTGDIILRRKFDVGEKETADTLYKKHVIFGKEMLRELMHKFKIGNVSRIPQDESEHIEYWEGRRLKDGKIDWCISASQIERLIRATTIPYPGAFTMRESRKVIIWDAEIVEENSSFEKIPGTILDVTTDGVLVKCGKNLLLLKRITVSDNMKQKTFYRENTKSPHLCFTKKDIGERFV